MTVGLHLVMVSTTVVVMTIVVRVGVAVMIGKTTPVPPLTPVPVLPEEALLAIMVALDRFQWNFSPGFSATAPVTIAERMAIFIVTDWLGQVFFLTMSKSRDRVGRPLKLAFSSVSSVFVVF